jgi:hypothetical protein
MAERVGVKLRDALEHFYAPSQGWPRTISPASQEGICRLLRDFQGGQSISELSQALGESRFVVSRWLSGRTEPRLNDFLKYIDKGSLRLLDFLEVMVSPARLPSAARSWQQLVLARELAYQAPWSHAVLRLLELDDYQKLERHQPGLIASRLGISLEEEERYLLLLRQSGQITRRKGRFYLKGSGVIDTRKDAARSRQIRAFWSRVAADRIEKSARGEFAFNLFGVSRADLERIRALQQAYFRDIRNIIGRSQPVEEVVLMNLQLVPLTSGRD